MWANESKGVGLSNISVCDAIAAVHNDYVNVYCQCSTERVRFQWFVNLRKLVGGMK
jgi:hypothetical protein